jgi:hypothetical protein
MRFLIVASSVLALTVAAAPAWAGDLLFPGKDVSTLTANAAHQPYWALLAQCAGAFGAAQNYEVRRGDQGAADQDAATGVKLLNEAIDRLQHDRGLSHDDALALASDQVSDGHGQGDAILAHGVNASWSWKRSACEAVEESYNHQRRNG